MTDHIRNIVAEEYDDVMAHAVVMDRRWTECIWDRSELDKKKHLIESEIKRIEEKLKQLQAWLDANPGFVDANEAAAKAEAELRNE